MALRRLSVTQVQENLASGSGFVSSTRYEAKVLTEAGPITLSFDHSPTDDEIVAALPPQGRVLAATQAVGKAALKDILDAQIAEAQAWDWFNVKAQADAAIPAGAKTALQGQTDAEYAEAKRLAIAWRNAT